MPRCLYCYKELERGEVDMHPPCSRRFYGVPEPPLLSYSENQMAELAGSVLRGRLAVPGVQPKLSLDLDPPGGPDVRRRLTIVGFWGEFILKPPTSDYPHLPELEDATMHLAELTRIATVPHALIRMQSGALAYITRRIDREKKRKIHMEDMCQLTGRLTEQKYTGSYEQIAKAIERYSVNPGLDVINVFEQSLFSFLTGNTDMHLKNFSLIKRPDIGYVLSPAYDMVASALVIEDNEELALTLNGKKGKLRWRDFQEAMDRCSIDRRVQANMLAKFSASIPAWFELMERSFLPDNLQAGFVELIQARRGQIGLDI